MKKDNKNILITVLIVLIILLLTLLYTTANEGWVSLVVILVTLGVGMFISKFFKLTIDTAKAQKGWKKAFRVVAIFYVLFAILYMVFKIANEDNMFGLDMASADALILVAGFIFTVFGTLIAVETSISDKLSDNK